MQGTAKEVAGECKQKEQTPNKIQNFKREERTKVRMTATKGLRNLHQLQPNFIGVRESSAEIMPSQFNNDLGGLFWVVILKSIHT